MSAHTPGPWRWEVNEKSKTMHLVGGVPQFDLTIIDFERWGLGGAIMRLRDTSLDGMNLMSRCLAWCKPVVGREHHADWFKDIDHPDARLIAAAPDLLKACQQALAALKGREHDQFLRDAIAKATLAPRHSANEKEMG